MRTPLFIISLVISSAIPSYAFGEDTKTLSIEVQYDELKMDSRKLDSESARRAMAAKRSDFAACGLAEGKLNLSFHVSESGQINDSDAVLSPKRNQETEECFKKVLSKVDFGFAGVQQTVTMSLQFEIGLKERESERLAKQQTDEVKQARLEASRPKPEETKTNKENREYLEHVKANALKEMGERNAKQNLILRAKLACTAQYRKDNLVENYERCMADSQYGGAKAAAAISESIKSCHRTCESQRSDLEMKCQNCSGGPVARNNCVSSCQRNIASQIDRCSAGCR